MAIYEFATHYHLERRTRAWEAPGHSARDGNRREGNYPTATAERNTELLLPAGQPEPMETPPIYAINRSAVLVLPAQPFLTGRIRPNEFQAGTCGRMIFSGCNCVCRGQRCTIDQSRAADGNNAMDHLPEEVIAIGPPASRGPGSSVELVRRLSLGDSIAIVVGIMIGGGIFLVPNLVARSVLSMPLIMSVWILAGVISFFGALACAELGAAFPSTGGQYVFLREAYGPAAGFLCGWSLFTVARSAQVAWMSVVFSIYASYLVPFGPLVSKLISLAVLSVFA